MSDNKAKIHNDTIYCYECGNQIELDEDVDRLADTYEVYDEDDVGEHEQECDVCGKENIIEIRASITVNYYIEDKHRYSSEVKLLGIKEDCIRGYKSRYLFKDIHVLVKADEWEYIKQNLHTHMKNSDNPESYVNSLYDVIAEEVIYDDVKYVKLILR